MFSELLSIYDIAKQTGHSPVSIHQAVERLKIEPELKTRGGHRYFDPAVVETLRDNMRQPANHPAAAKKESAQ